MLAREAPAMNDKTGLAKRPALQERSARSEAAAFKALDAAHAAAGAMLQQFQQLVAALAARGADGNTQRVAREVLHYFEGPGRNHHEDEERLVFPTLLGSEEPALMAQVRRLQQDHHWLEQDWRELEPHVRAVAEGYNGYDLPFLEAALPVFDALYHDHIALEETEVYPAARRFLQARRASQRGRVLVA
jgi:iron-sulfur cluster repair protein YtfE (RIC family)